MKGSFLLALLLVGLAGDLASGSEKKEHGSAHKSEDGGHNEAHDAEAMLGSQAAVNEFSKLTPEEAKKQLTDIVKKIDTNKDGFVSKQELTQWILKSFIIFDYEEATKSLKDYDGNKDGKITWKEYVKRMESTENDTKSDSYKIMMKEDKKKFSVADVDNDGSLTMKEYAAFMHPYDFEHMHDIEIDLSLPSIDKDKDGKVNLKEFVGEGFEKDEEANKDHFDKFDKNKDGLLDREELRPWIVPENDDEAGKEADHLISQTDHNKDGKMSLEEILEKVTIWGGSAATTYKGNHDEL